MRFTLALLTLAAAVSAQKYNGPNPWFCSSPGNDCCNGPKGNECSVRGECPCLASTNQNGGPEPECVDWASPVNVCAHPTDLLQ